MDPSLTALAPGAAGTQPASTSAPAPGATGQPAVTPSAAPMPAPSPGTGVGASQATSPDGGAGQAGAVGEGAAEHMGVREALAGYGIDLRNQFQDDHSALQHLALAYRQAQERGQLAQYGQLYLQHADTFNAYLRAQQDQAKQQQAQQSQWWKAPEYDARWLSQITRDAQTGELRALPGTDPTVVQKYLAWQDHQRGFMDRFAADPIQAIRPGLEQVAQQIAERVIQERLGGFQERSAAEQFVAQNSGWLHARDAQGGVIQGASGRPELSALGQRFAGYVQEAVRMGIPDVQGHERYALALLQRDVLLAAQQRPAPAQQVQAQQQANDEFLRQAQAAQHRPSAGGSVNAPAPNGQQPSQNTGLPLRQRLSDAMRQAGYQESTLLAVGQR